MKAVRHVLACAICLVLCAATSTFAQTKSKSKATTGARSASGKSAAEKPKYKGIFEAMSYPEDIELHAVLFADDKNGWAAGGVNVMQGGVILHTADGGESWQVEAGDLQSTERGFTSLRAASADLLFAKQDEKLWRY